MTRTTPKSNKAPEGQQAIQSIVSAFERGTGKTPTIWEIGNHLANNPKLNFVEPQVCRNLNGEFLGAVGKDNTGTVLVVDRRGVAASRDDMCGYNVLGTAAAQALIGRSGAPVTYNDAESQAAFVF
ncbi:MAG: hypothetical protein H6855_05485 [Rhodospirillales bacterium]|nr:hypothetical protein [Rhodospirillales bacterium]